MDEMEEWQEFTPQNKLLEQSTEMSDFMQISPSRKKNSSTEYFIHGIYSLTYTEATSTLGLLHYDHLIRIELLLEGGNKNFWDVIGS